MNCPNCNSKLSCGCQKRKASDGKDICSNCMMEYESIIANSLRKNNTVGNNNSPTDIKIEVTHKPLET